MSKLLSAILLPAAMWGLLSSLILQLIALRSLFIHGGESKLRFATLAFALGIVLVQRLSAEQGRSLGRAYGAALGAAMLLFSVAHTLQWREGFNPWLMLAGNVVLLGLLWWAGNKVTGACAVDRASARIGGESGILGGREAAGAKTEPQKPDAAQEPMVWMGEPEGPGEGEPETVSIYEEFMEMKRASIAARRKRETEKDGRGGIEIASDEDWATPLTGKHPGRSLLGFAMVAIPLFGIGELLLGGDAEGKIELAIRLFLYLWCSLTLLWIAGMGQLRAYFEQRGLSLPEVCGMTWIGVGTTTVLLALTLAFLLPQPASPGSSFVRDRIEATYSGTRSNRGMQEEGAGGNASSNASGGEGGGGEASNSGPKGGGKSGEQGASKGQMQPSPQGQGADSQSRQSRMQPPFEETRAGKLFTVFMYALFAVCLIAIVAGVFVALAYGLQALRANLPALKVLRRPRRAKPKRRGKNEDELPKTKFAAFRDPFRGAGELKDGDALVRYLWEATVAFCADSGQALEPGATPMEIAEGVPPPLEDFRDRLRWIASLFCFSEFSGQPVPESERPKLEDYWRALQAAARGEIASR